MKMEKMATGSGVQHNFKMWAIFLPLLAAAVFLVHGIVTRYGEKLRDVQDSELFGDRVVSISSQLEQVKNQKKENEASKDTCKTGRRDADTNLDDCKRAKDKTEEGHIAVEKKALDLDTNLAKLKVDLEKAQGQLTIYQEQREELNNLKNESQRMTQLISELKTKCGNIKA